MDKLGMIHIHYMYSTCEKKKTKCMLLVTWLKIYLKGLEDSVHSVYILYCRPQFIFYYDENEKADLFISPQCVLYMLSPGTSEVKIILIFVYIWIGVRFISMSLCYLFCWCHRKWNVPKMKRQRISSSLQFVTQICFYPCHRDLRA